MDEKRGLRQNEEYEVTFGGEGKEYLCLVG